MRVHSCAILALFMLTGCERDLYQPELATRPYPAHLHRPQSIDVQVFRKGDKLLIYNATARSFSDFDLWVNQRFTKRIETLPAGGNISVSLWDFRDELGDVFNAGGLFRVHEPTPVRLVEIQTGDDEPMIGLITIREEPIE